MWTLTIALLSPTSSKRQLSRNMRDCFRRLITATLRWGLSIMDAVWKNKLDCFSFLHVLFLIHNSLNISLSNQVLQRHRKMTSVYKRRSHIHFCSSVEFRAVFRHWEPANKFFYPPICDGLLVLTIESNQFTVWIFLCCK